MRRIRVGIVGCGEVVQIMHLPSLYQLRNQFQVTALCDVSAAVLDGVGGHWNVAKCFLDYQELVAQNDVDAVLIANPHAYHAEATLAAIRAGKHVLVEKPMCFTLHEANTIIAAQQRTHVIVQVGYMRRYAPAFIQACRLVQEMSTIRLARVHDVIGENALIVDQTSYVIRGDDIPSDVLAEGRSFQAERLAEAVNGTSTDLHQAYILLLGLGSHDTSAMREMLGMPREVIYAVQRQGGRSVSAAFDYNSYVCHFEIGVDDIPRYDTAIEVYGTDRVLKVHYDTPYVRNMPIRLTLSEANGQGGVTEHTSHPAWGDPFVAEWQAFYDNVVNSQEPKTSPTDFREDLELFQEMIRMM